MIILPEAIGTVINALETDALYRETWKSNIAMSFYDELSKHEFGGRADIHKAELATVCNNAAERFLKQLCHSNKQG